MPSSRGNGSDVVDFYEVGGPISESAFGNGGEVLHCTRIGDGCPFAVKKIVKRASFEDESQIQAMNKLDHPGITKLVDWFDDEEMLYIVMELASGGDMCERIIEESCLPEVDAAISFRQILSAVRHMHSQGIVHADIKPENILYESANRDIVKLTDFGSAQIVENGQATFSTRAGTLAYSAPEVLEQRELQTASDMWSLGVLLYTMLSGFTPFGHPSTCSRHKIASRIRKCELDFSDPIFNTVSSSAIDLIRSLVACDPKDRLTAAQALEHPWFAEKIPNLAYTCNQLIG